MASWVAQAVGAKNRWVESHRRDCLLHKVKECAVGEGGTEQVDLKEGVGGGLTGPTPKLPATGRTGRLRCCF